MIDQSKINFSDDEKSEIKERLRAYSKNLGQFAAKDGDAVYENKSGRDFDYRSNYGRDIDEIINNVFYARFGDKTQVHSFFKNDDVTRRALHVQFVSKIARSIGIILNLNLELIEAVALGHDIGHTPFGHRGEVFLSNLYEEYGNKLFNHNVHSVRVLKDISKKSSGHKLSLQTLDGILCHNGELLVDELVPHELKDFGGFEKKYQSGYSNREILKTYRANTIEGCLVRMCDILAYVGKDRLDLVKVGTPAKYLQFEDHGIGIRNSDMLSAVVTNLIKNSLDKPYIKLDKEVTRALEQAKKDNNEIIYNSKEVTEKYKSVEILFEKIFTAALCDLKNGTDNSFIGRNYLSESYFQEYRKDISEGKYSHADIVTDYIACMTDDYFVDLAKEMELKEAADIEYTGYFSKQN